MKANHLREVTKELEIVKDKIERLEIGGGNLSLLRTYVLQRELLEQAIEIYKLKNKEKRNDIL